LVSFQNLIFPEDHLIDYEKLRLTTEEIENFLKSATCYSYDIEPDERIQSYFDYNLAFLPDVKSSGKAELIF
jgi:hypothetical protein